MPQQGNKKKKKGRAPAHQNTFAFRHNPKSKLTEKILNSPNVGVCKRCYDKIEWRKKYRKYKPRTQPGKCNFCSRRNVLAAYHTICSDCAASDKAFASASAAADAAATPIPENATTTDETTTTQTPATAATVDRSSSTCIDQPKNDTKEILSPNYDNVDSNKEKDDDDDTDVCGSTTCSLPSQSLALSSAQNQKNSCSSTTITKSRSMQYHRHQHHHHQQLQPKQRRGKICAVCIKHPVMVDPNNVNSSLADEQVENYLKERLANETGRLSLREQKTIERKIRQIEQEEKGIFRNDLEKEKRGKEYDDDDDDEEEEEEEDIDSDNKVDGEEQSDAESIGSEVEEFHDDDDEEEDPFLKAVGGADKLLMGEAYQKMLLEKEEQRRKREAFGGDTA